MTEKDKKFHAFLTNEGEIIKIDSSEAKEVIIPESSQLTDTMFYELYKSGKVAKPKYPVDKLLRIVDINTYNLRCIKQKATDVVGLGYDLLQYDTNIDNKEKYQNDYNKLITFFTNCNHLYTFEEILYRAWCDFEAIGWLVIEVTRNRLEEPAGLYHIPAWSCRLLLDGSGIVQRRNNQERVFKFFGDSRIIIDPNTGKPTTEVIYMNNYCPNDEFYGVPDYITAIGAMIGNNEARDYNINFFSNNAVPYYAVIFEGGELTDEVENTVKKFFRDHIKGTKNSHRTLILTAPEGGKIRLEPVAVEVKDGHFRLYRKDNRDEIVHAHGVPGYRIGIIETGTLGGNIAEESTEIYKQSIIQPRQRRLEQRFTKLIKLGFKIDSHYFKFKEIDTEDIKLKAEVEKIKAETAKIYYDCNSLIPNEIRNDYLLKDKLENSDGDLTKNEIKEKNSQKQTVKQTKKVS